MSESPETMQLVYAIAKYLRLHPNACDTPDGVKRWWLARAGATGGTLQNALNVLGQRGIIEVVQEADGCTRYRLSTSPAVMARLGALIEFSRVLPS